MAKQYTWLLQGSLSLSFFLCLAWQSLFRQRSEVVGRKRKSTKGRWDFFSLFFSRGGGSYKTLKLTFLEASWTLSWAWSRFTLKLSSSCFFFFFFNFIIGHEVYDTVSLTYTPTNYIRAQQEERQSARENLKVLRKASHAWVFVNDHLRWSWKAKARACFQSVLPARVSHPGLFWPSATIVKAEPRTSLVLQAFSFLMCVCLVLVFKNWHIVKKTFCFSSLNIISATQSSQSHPMIQFHTNIQTDQPINKQYINT